MLTSEVLKEAILKTDLLIISNEKKKQQFDRLLSDLKEYTNKGLQFYFKEVMRLLDEEKAEIQKQVKNN